MLDLDKALLAYELRDIRFFLDPSINIIGNSIERLIVNFVAGYINFREDGTVSYNGGPDVDAQEVRKTLENVSGENVSGIDEFIEWCNDCVTTKAKGTHVKRTLINGFTCQKMKCFLNEAGFRQVTVSELQNSAMPELRSSEFESNSHGRLFIESIK